MTRELEPVPTSVDQTTTTLFLADVRVEPLPVTARYGDDSVALRATALLRTISGDEIPRDVGPGGVREGTGVGLRLVRGLADTVPARPRADAHDEDRGPRLHGR